MLAAKFASKEDYMKTSILVRSTLLAIAATLAFVPLFMRAR